MIGAAACARYDRARRQFAQHRADAVHARRIALELRAHHGGRLRGLERHARLGLHEDALSSATKS